MSDNQNEMLDVRIKESKILKESSEKIFQYINDPALLLKLKEDDLEYRVHIMRCLQAIINLEDASYPTRPRVDIKKDGFEFRSANTGIVMSIDRF
jgi:hypothetical protein